MKALLMWIYNLYFCVKIHRAKVIDQNAFRDEKGWKLRRHLFLGGWVLITDVSFAEMVKSPSKWEYTFNRSTEIIQKYRKQVFILHGVGTIFRDEIATRVPIGRRLKDAVAWDLTAIFRNHLKMWNKESTELRRLLKSNIGNAQALANNQYFNDAENRTNLLAWIDAWKSTLGPDGIKILRRARDKWSLIREYIETTDLKPLVKDTLLKTGIRPDIATELSTQGSLYFNIIVVNQSLALNWIAQDGAPNASPNKITNDIADADYVSHALLFGGIITYESRVISLYEVNVSQKLIPTFLDALKACLTRAATDVKTR